MPSEFELIARYFTHAPSRADVRLGVGDDAAVLGVPPGQELVVTTDTLVAGVHFPERTPPEAVGHKVLAVNLSDLAAMGADPAWVTLAITLPSADEHWLADFSRGFAALARLHGVDLVGGDTTRGPLSITVQAMGLVPAGQALRRSGAGPGDLLYVSGTLGDAGLALAALNGEVLLGGADAEDCLRRLDRPTPRMALGRALRGLASAAIDVSDGLLADLGHMLQASGAGALIELERLPLSAPVRRRVREARDWTLPLASGDDYELLFSVPASRRDALTEVLRGLDVEVTCIGRIEAAGLRLVEAGGRDVAPARLGYDHFAGGPR